MKKLLLLLFLIPNLAFSEEKDKLYIENILKNLHIEMGEISAKIAFCREYGSKKQNYFLYGIKMQEAFAVSTGRFGHSACLYFEKKESKNYCEKSNNENMSIMWNEYARWKSKLTNPLYDIEKGCNDFIPQINNSKLYQRTVDIYEFLKEKAPEYLLTDSLKELEKIKNLKIKK